MFSSSSKGRTTMGTSLRVARLALARLGERGRTTAIPGGVRQVLVAYALEQRERGKSSAAIAEALGVSSPGLIRWSRGGWSGARERCRGASRGGAERRYGGGPGVSRGLPGRRARGLRGAGGASRARMIGSARSLRVWAYPAPADLRKGFDGLAGLVQGELRKDLLISLRISRDREH